MGEERELFERALGLGDPWRVERIDFNEEKTRLEVGIGFARGTRFACPECGVLSPVHDTTEKRFRHLDFFQHEAYLVARVPRVRCEKHAVRQVEVPWARPGSGFTLLFEALVMTLAREMPVNAMAELVREHWHGVVRWWESRISNGLLEGLHSLVQAAKRRARGYRSTRNYIAMIYLVVGKLDLPRIHTI